MSRSAAAVVLSCEHATARVPGKWRRALEAWLSPAEAQAFADALKSHRGIDFGALGLARALAQHTGWPLWAARHSRLLVDCNRSARHPQLFSPFSRRLPASARARLLEEAYTPHVTAVATAVAAAAANPAGRRKKRSQDQGAQPRVIHLALHSFTPVLAGQRRELDVGVLYDPARSQERRLADALIAELTQISPSLRVRRNAPYRGAADGLPTQLRRKYSDATYAGVELECNQAWVARPSSWRRLRIDLVGALARACKNF